MTVPIDLDVGTLDAGIGNDFVLNESQQFSNSVRRHVTAGVTDTDPVST